MKTLRSQATALLVAILAIPLITTGCFNREPEHAQGPTAPEPSGSFPDAYLANPQAYPSSCFALPVPWMSQMPPKNPNHSDEYAWTQTNNCGQACCAMLGGYYNNGSTAPWVIDAENDFLHHPKPYGNTTGASTLQYLLREFHALNSNSFVGNGPDDVVMEGARGRPVIVGVRTRMQLTGRPHWMLFVGLDGNYMYFHDFGRSRAQDGRYVRYTVNQFWQCWNNQGRKYIPVYR